VAILGGAKISDKIGVVDNLLGRVDALLIGGGMANTFLKAQGYQVGQSLVEEESLPLARELLDKAGRKLVLPMDVVVADKFDAEAQSKIVGVGEVPAEWRILDIGPATVERFAQELTQPKPWSGTALWGSPSSLGSLLAPRPSSRYWPRARRRPLWAAEILRLLCNRRGWSRR
jgi:phosphoglycerate kinase